MKPSARAVLQALRGMLKGKVVIVGVGNRLRGDDGLGPALVDRLKPKLAGHKRRSATSGVSLTCIDAGSAPENHFGSILKEDPDTVLFVDAVHLGRRPGECEIFDPGEVVPGGFSTHDPSPGVFFDLFRESLRGELHFLGVQPGRIALGGSLSRAVRRTLGRLEKGIVEALWPGRQLRPLARS